MIIDINYYKKIGIRLLLIILTILGIYIGYKISIFYIPFLIAFIITLIIEPVIRVLMKYTKLTRKNSAIITMIVVFGIIIGLLIWGIYSVIAESSNLLSGLNDYVGKITYIVNNITNNIRFDKIQMPENIKLIIENSTNDTIQNISNTARIWLNNIINSIKYLPSIMIYIGITIISTYFICADRIYILDQIEYHLPKKWANKLGSHARNIISSVGNYLKAQAVLILIAFFIVLLGLYIFKLIGWNVEYPLIAALGIGFVDALPILGSGTIMIPWAIISATNGNINLAIGLIVLYIVIIVTRQLVEPKIVSNHIGIHPIFTLIAMYTGFKIVGVIGMFVGPIILIIIKNIFGNIIDKGVFKTILDRK